MGFLSKTVFLCLVLNVAFCHDEVYNLEQFLGLVEQFEASYHGPNSVFRQKASFRELAHGLRALVPNLDDLRHRYLLFGVYGLVTDPNNLVGADKTAVPDSVYNHQSLTSVPEDIRNRLNDMLEFKVEKDGNTHHADGVIKVHYPDDTFDTIATGYLILGVCAGLEYNPTANFNLEQLNNLVVMTIGAPLVASVLDNRSGSRRQKYVGPNGTWNDPEKPHVYTLDSAPSAAIDAQVMGAVDGFIIGQKLTKLNKNLLRALSLPEILRQYYNQEAKYRFYYFFQELQRLELKDEVYKCARVCAREKACSTSGIYDLQILECKQDDKKLRAATEAVVDSFYQRFMTWVH